MLTDTRRTQIVTLIQELIGDPNREITNNLPLTDLDIDSLDAAELSLQLEEWVADLQQTEQEPVVEFENWETVGDIMKTVEELL